MTRASIFLSFFLFWHSFFAQNNNRIGARYSIKEIDTAGVQKISMGELFLDKKTKTLRFSQRFPDTRAYVLHDSVLNVKKTDSSYKALVPKSLLDYSIYSIILAGKLQDYGLSQSAYTLKTVKEEEGLVIMIYSAPKKSNFGNIDLVKKNGKLDAIIVYTAAGKMQSQSFFREYTAINGIQIPQKIIQIAHFGTKQTKKITTLSKILIDEIGRNTLYNP